MWFKRKKNSDKKLRFQQVAFKRQLQEARTYKRNARTRDSYWWWLTWRRFGLLCTALSLCAAAVYICVMPNLFFVQSVEVVGDGVDIPGVHATVENFLNKKNHLAFPNRNMLFLNTAALSEYLLSSNLAVNTVTSITKDVKRHSIRVAVEPRINVFLVESQGKQFILANDGTVVASAADVSDSNVLLRVLGGGMPVVGQPYLTNDMVDTLSTLREQFVSITGLSIAYVELGDARGGAPEHGILLASQELFVVTDALPERHIPEVKIFFDSRTNISSVLENLRTLLDTISRDRKERLVYIDVRFKERGFICLSGSSCQEPPQPPPPEVLNMSGQLEVEQTNSN